MSTSDVLMHTTTTPEGLETKPLYGPGELSWRDQLVTRYREVSDEQAAEEAAT